MPPRSSRTFRLEDAPVLRTPRAKAALRTVADTGGLISRNVVVDGHRTSLRLERMVWDTLETIATREGLDLNAVVTSIAATKQPEASLSSAARIFVAAYFGPGDR